MSDLVFDLVTDLAFDLVFDCFFIPQQDISPDIYWYYMMELSFYWCLVYTMLTDHKRKVRSRARFIRIYNFTLSHNDDFILSILKGYVGCKLVLNLPKQAHGAP